MTSLWPIDEKEPGGSATLRGPKTWEEAHKVVLEYEHREAIHRASANSIFTYDQDPPDSAAAEARKELDKLKAEAKKLAKANATAAAKAAEHQSMLALQDKGAGKGGKKICFHFRDHGSCPKNKDCPYSHDRELRKQALAGRNSAGGSSEVRDTRTAVRPRPKQRPRPKPARRAVGKAQAARPRRCALSSPRMGPVRRARTAIWFTLCRRPGPALGCLDGQPVCCLQHSGW